MRYRSREGEVICKSPYMCCPMVYHRSQLRVSVSHCYCAIYTPHPSADCDISITSHTYILLHRVNTYAHTPVYIDLWCAEWLGAVGSGPQINGLDLFAHPHIAPPCIIYCSYHLMGNHWCDIGNWPIALQCIYINTPSLDSPPWCNFSDLILAVGAAQAGSNGPDLICATMIAECQIFTRFHVEWAFFLL